MKVHALLSSLALLCAMPVIPEALPRVAVAVSTRAVGTDLWVIYTLSVAGSPDSVVATTTASGQATVRRVYPGAAKDSVRYVRPAPSITVAGAVAAYAVRRGMVSTTVTVPWSYTEPDVAPPPPTLLPPVIRPATWSMDTSQSKQFCAIIVWSNGDTYNAVGQDTIPACVDQLAAYRLGL